MDKKYVGIMGYKRHQESLTCKIKSLLGLMTNGLDGLLKEWYGSLRKCYRWTVRF